jgi:hypothetical protein
MNTRSSQYGQDLAGALLERLAQTGAERLSHDGIELTRNPDGSSYQVQMNLKGHVSMPSPYEAIVIVLASVWDVVYQAIFDQVTRQYDADYDPTLYQALRTQDRLVLAYRDTANRLARGNRADPPFEL